MKVMKKMVGIMLSLVLVLGMIMPNIKVNATGDAKVSVEKVEAKYHGVVVEGMKPEQIDDSKVEYICTFSDGNKESFYKHEKVLGFYVAPSLFPEKVSDDGTWGAGKQYLTGTLCDKEFRLEIDVVSKADSPIKAISAVAESDLVPDWHWGSYDMGKTKFLQVEYCNPKVTVTYSDGTQETMTYKALKSRFKGVEPRLWLDDNSLQGTGKRTANLDFYGRSCTFDVNVIDNPVDHISAVTTKPLVKGFRGNIYSLVWDGGLLITVHYKDGREISGSPDDLLALLNDLPDDMTYADMDKVTVGKNVRKMKFLNRMCDVEYEVIEDKNPVVSLSAKLKDGAVLYQNTSSYNRAWYNYGHLIDVTLTYKDGTTLSGTIDKVNQHLDKTDIYEVATQDSQSDDEWTIGKHQVTVSYKDLEKTVEVEVVDNPYSKVTISNTDDFTVVLEKKGGEKETYKASKFDPSGSNGSSHNMLGYLETDKGTLPVEVKFAGGRHPDYTELSYMIVNGIKSNALQDCKWIEQQMMTKMYGDVPKITVNNSASELKEMVLTDMDYLRERESETEVWLEASEKAGNISTEDQTLLNQATEQLKDYETGVVLDFTLYKQYNTISGEVKEKVPEPNGKVSITMAVPEEVLASGTDPSTIKMIRIHDGKTEVLSCVYDATAKTITFETDAFSTYSLVYQGTGTNSQPSSPKTGDSHAVMGYMVLCFAMMAVMFVSKRRKY